MSLTIRHGARAALVSLLGAVFLITACGAAAQDVAPVPTIQLAQRDPDLFLDVEWYRQTLIESVDLWNGGLEGKTGMGTYDEDFDGFFHVNLDRAWNPTMMWSTTSVAQSRAIYMNVEAYRAAGPEEGERFLRAVVTGTDYLLERFRDEENGGFYWELDPRGRPVNPIKHGYGNMHPLFVLAHAYDVTQNPTYLDAALTQLAVIEGHFVDPDYPGGILPGFTRDFSQVLGVKNVDTFTHWFEALLALYDVTEGEQQDHVADLIVRHGNFLVEQLYVDQEGYDDRGYVAYNYDFDWRPSQEKYTRETQWSGAMHASPGHGIELAYLLSRAVERGFNPEWLDVADKMITFCLEYAVHPTYGGMLYDTLDYEGKPLEGNPDNPYFTWWAQAETARALLHFLVVRGEEYAGFAERFKLVETLIHDYLTDPDYGGWYHSLDATKNLRPSGREKGDVWKVNYHYSMFFTEVLRLDAVYPDVVESLNERQAATAASS